MHAHIPNPLLRLLPHSPARCIRSSRSKLVGPGARSSTTLSAEANAVQQQQQGGVGALLERQRQAAAPADIQLSEWGPRLGCGCSGWLAGPSGGGRFMAGSMGSS